MPRFIVEWNTTAADNLMEVVEAPNADEAIRYVRIQVSSMGHVIKRPISDPLEFGDQLTEEAFALVPVDVATLEITATEITPPPSAVGPRPGSQE